MFPVFACGPYRLMNNLDSLLLSPPPAMPAKKSTVLTAGDIAAVPSASARADQPDATLSDPSVVEKKAPPLSKGEVLRQFVVSLPQAALAEILWDIAGQHRDVKAALKAVFARSQSATNPRALVTLVNDVMATSGFLDWRSAKAYCQKVAPALVQLESALAEQPVAVRKAAEAAMLKLYTVTSHADDSAGYLGDLMRRTAQLIADAVALSPPEAAWAERLLELLDEDPFGVWSETAVLEAAGPAVSARYFELVKAAFAAVPAPAPIAAPRPGEVAAYVRYDATWFKHRDRVIAAFAAAADVRGSYAFQRDSAHYAYDFIQWISFCEAHGLQREGFDAAERAYAKFPDDSRIETAVLLAYERDGWDQEAHALHQRRFDRDIDRHNNEALYLALLASAEKVGLGVEAQRKAIMQQESAREQQELAKRETLPVATHKTYWGQREPSEQESNVHPNVSRRVRWWLAEDNWKQALALSQHEAWIDLSCAEQLALALPASHHAQAVLLLKRRLHHAMLGAGSPYREPLNLVGLIQERMASSERAEFIAMLRLQYRTKRHFIAALPS
jgi:hypothetical protein